MKKLLSIFQLFVSIVVLSAATIHVPTDYATIQEGVHASADGDTVLVADGIYYENISVNREITLASHFIIDGDISHRDATIIDGSNYDENSGPFGSCVLFRPSEIGEAISAKLTGFTIQNGQGTRVRQTIPAEDVTVDTSVWVYDGMDSTLVDSIMTVPGTPITITYYMGGGLMIDHCLPEITYNYIRNNGGASDTRGAAPRRGGGSGLNNRDDVEFDEDRSEPRDRPVLTRDDEIIFANNIFENNDSETGNTFESIGYLGDLDFSNSFFDVFASEYEDVSEYWVTVDEAGVDFSGGSGEMEAVTSDVWVDTYGTDGSDISGTEEQPFKTINYALSVIYQVGDDPVNINLLEGTYSPSTGESYPIVMISNVNLIGEGEDLITLDAEETNRVITMEDCVNNTIANLTIMGGSSSNWGGGMFLDNSNPTLSQLTLENNSAYWYGGGIYSKNSDIVMNNVTFRSNHGDFSAGGLKGENGSLELSGCTFEGNTSDTFSGGISVNNTNIAITNSTFINDVILLYSSDISVVNTDFTRTDDHPGGTAISLYWGGNLFIEGSTFNGTNKAITSHGGIGEIRNTSFSNNIEGSMFFYLADSLWNYDGDELIIDGCDFNGNGNEDSWSDLYVSGFNLSLTNCTFTDASSSAIFMYHRSATIDNCMITNSSGWPGTVNSYYQELNINNSSFGDNQSTAIAQYYGSAVINNSSFNNNASGYLSYYATEGGNYINDCSFDNNQGHGFNISSGGSWTVTSSTFNNNQGRGLSIWNSDSPTMTSSTFNNNQGGGINIYSSGGTFDDCTINNNSTEWGGAGLYAFQHPDSSSIFSPTFSNCVFYGNQSPDGAGGGASLANNISPIFENTSFTSNSASSSGGAINISNANAVMDNCQFYNNTAGGSGGAINISNFNNIEMEISNVFRNCTFRLNSSSDGGGAVSSMYHGNPLFVNCTFSDNISTGSVTGGTTGGGIYINLGSRVRVVNSILWNNFPDEISVNFSNYNDLNNMLTVAYSDIKGSIDGIEINTNPSSEDPELIWLEGNIDADPLFASPLANDLTLQEGSPCIDAGVSFLEINSETVVGITPSMYNGSAPDMGANENYCEYYDECNVCDGPGAIYECGCSDIAYGNCDCDGNIADCNGDCGGGASVDDCDDCGGLSYEDYLLNDGVISGGMANSLFLNSDGTVTGAGQNANGQIDIPEGLNNIISVELAQFHVLALRSDGTVVAWGNPPNDYGLTNVPEDLTDVIKISNSPLHNIALRSDGTVVSWGYQIPGSLGVPEGLENVISVSAGWTHGLALGSDGTVSCWGFNNYGVCDIPEELDDVIEIASGNYHNLALRSDGTVVTWGLSSSDNSYAADIPGTCGPEGLVTLHGEDCGSIEDEQFCVLSGCEWDPDGLAGYNVAHISAKQNHSLAVKIGGEVVAWGDNGFGQTDIPADLQDVAGVEAGFWTNYALKYDGTFEAWGYCSFGVCDTPDSSFTLNITSALCCEDVVDECGVCGGPGAVYGNNGDCCGDLVDECGVCDGSGISEGECDCEGNVEDCFGECGGVAILDECGICDGPGEVYECGCEDMAEGTCDCEGNVEDCNGVCGGDWIVDDCGICGGSDFHDYLVIDNSLSAGRHHNLAILPDGTIEAWGNNDYGQCDVPDGLENVVDVSGGQYHSLALRSDGTVEAWGNNEYGQTDIPENLENVVAVAASYSNSFALRSDGTVVAWGWLVPGTMEVPEELTDVVLISSVGTFALALKSDGTVVAWGNNVYGQCDVPDDLNDVISIASGYNHSLALRSNGTVVTWGQNDPTYGYQCDVPEGLEDVVAIGAGWYHSLALRSDGTVEAWGWSSFGLDSTPEGLADVASVDGGFYHSLALQSDGLVSAWGGSTFGAIDVPEGLIAMVPELECCESEIYDDCGICDGPGAIYGDTGCCEQDVDGCGVCNGDNSLCSGCMDESASNYDPEAIFEDGSCLYLSDLLVEYNSGWNIVGLPMEVEDSNYQSLFPNAQSNTLYSFNGIYQSEETLEQGTGYLLRITTDDPVSFLGIPNEELSISLSEGWNLFSGLSSSLSPEEIYAQDIIQNGTIYGLDGIYFTPETIDPGKGYWVRAIVDGEMTIEPYVPPNLNVYSLNFDGQNDYIDCGNDQSLKITNNTISLVAWVKAETISSWDVIAMKTSSSGWSDGYGMYLQNNTIFFWVSGYSSNAASKAFTVDGQWHYVVGTYDGSNVRIWVDGVEGTSDSYTGNISDTNSPFEIGRGSSNSYNFDGLLDNFQVWNRALTEEEVQASMYSEPSGNEDGLVGYWNFEEGEGDVAHDQSTQDNDGVLYGGLTWSTDIPPDNSSRMSKQSTTHMLDGANSITFSNGSYTRELYFGVEIPEEEILSYSLPPTFSEMVFDVRFSGNTKVLLESGEIEVINQSETVTIEYDIKTNAGKHMKWLIKSETGEEYTIEGSGEITVPSADKFTIEREAAIPVTFALYQNFPNPFNPITTLRYDLPRDALVTLSIYDMLGREIIQLVNVVQDAGFKSVQWDATDSMGRAVSAGVYLYQLQAGDLVQTKKMLLLK